MIKTKIFYCLANNEELCICRNHVYNVFVGLLALKIIRSYVNCLEFENIIFKFYVIKEIRSCFACGESIYGLMISENLTEEIKNDIKHSTYPIVSQNQGAVFKLSFKDGKPVLNMDEKS